MTKTEFFYVRPMTNAGVAPRGGITYAFQEANLDNVPGVFYAYAKCGPNDNFNKRYGRAKAQGRLNSNRLCEFYPGDRKQFIEAVLDGDI